ncbi:MAG TPA: M1 family aminopeptidase [Bryobacteraceae bacterium]|nr:M1 family aminopeptidase [Bryobacteraceae bacterium]
MSKCGASILILAFAAPLLHAGAAADLAHDIAQAGLDPQECYRVRDLTLTKEDLRLYFTEGYLIFGKPIGDAPVSAVFVTSAQGGDGEILALPPNKSERQSLASYTASPNLNEHFKVAVLLFTDRTYSDLITQIRENPDNKKTPEMGLTLAPEWASVTRNLTASFESRLVLDLFSGPRASEAFLFAAIGGRQLGNFDAIYDSRARQQITIGQVGYRDNRTFFDVWTAFESRSVRNRIRTAPAPEFELNDYRIDATLLPPDLRLQIVTRVKVKPTSGSGRVFPFDLSRQIRVSSASVDGRPAEVFEPESMRSNLIQGQGNDLLLLIPPQPLTPGREYEFEFHHEGAVIADVGNKVYAVGSRANWYPNRGLQFARFDLTFHYPKELDLVATGELVSDSVEGESRTTRRRATTPIRMAGFNLGMYERTKIVRGAETVELCSNRNLERALVPRPSEPLPITPPTNIRRRIGQPPVLSVPPEQPQTTSPAARLKELAGDIASAFEFMAARFGPPPLSTLTVSPVPGTFGQGFPGLIYLSTLSYLGPNNKTIAGLRDSQRMFFSEMLYAHEAAHQWWGNVVASAGYQHDWLLEALANYSALLYLEKHKGTRAMDSVLNDYRGDLLASQNGRTVESAGPIALGVRLMSSQNPKAWQTIVYEKGSWIMHMLRRRMGDERFLSFLAELRRRFEWKSVDTESFRLLAAGSLPPKAPDPKLEAFFDQWVYSSGIPTLHMKYSLSGKAPALKLTVTVEQSGVDDEFSVAVPVEIQFGKAKPLTRLARTSSEPAVFTVALRQAPTKVVLDPGNSVLAVKK